MAPPTPYIIPIPLAISRATGVDAPSDTLPVKGYIDFLNLSTIPGLLDGINVLIAAVDAAIFAILDVLTLLLTFVVGTADEATRINYFNSTIEPICSAIVDEFERKFLTKTARTQGQAIVFFRDPFKLVPVSQLADIADKFTRNEIMTSNEIRGEIGMKPVKDPKADMLINKNLNMTDEQTKQLYGEGTTDGSSNPSLVDGLLQTNGNQSIKGGESDA